MKKNETLDQQTIRQIIDSGAMLDALRIGSKRAVRMNKLLGLPVVTSRDGKVVWIPPEEIQVDDEGVEGQATHLG
jgi:hypothetical protein